MSKSVLVAAVALVTACAFPAFAQTTPAKAAKPTATKAAAKPAAPAALPTANSDQIQAAERTLLGAYACEFDQSVDVAASPRASG